MPVPFGRGVPTSGIFLDHVMPATYKDWSGLCRNARVAGVTCQVKDGRSRPTPDQQGRSGVVNHTRLYLPARAVSSATAPLDDLAQSPLQRFRGAMPALSGQPPGFDAEYDGHEDFNLR